MCHRHCHWASATDRAGIDRPRATGAGWGTHRVWCVSLLILVRDVSWAATPTQTALWDGRGVPEQVDVCLTCTFVHAKVWMGCPASQRVNNLRCDPQPSTWRKCPLTLCSLLLLLGNFLAEPMAHRADQWHSGIVALQALLLAPRLCVCMCKQKVPTCFIYACLSEPQLAGWAHIVCNIF